MLNNASVVLIPIKSFHNSTVSIAVIISLVRFSFGIILALYEEGVSSALVKTNSKRNTVVYF
jgi:hypothetical protein